MEDLKKKQDLQDLQSLMTVKGSGVFDDSDFDLSAPDDSSWCGLGCGLGTA